MSVDTGMVSDIWITATDTPAHALTRPQLQSVNPTPLATTIDTIARNRKRPHHRRDCQMPNVGTVRLSNCPKLGQSNSPVLGQSDSLKLGQSNCPMLGQSDGPMLGQTFFTRFEYMLISLLPIKGLPIEYI